MSGDRCELLCLDLPKAEAIRAGLPAPGALTGPAARMRALADPTRLVIAVALAASDELCVCDLAWVTGKADNLVSHHVRALRAAGLASSRREGKMVLYALTEPGRDLLRAATVGAPA
ncbi:helix-turn-helix transcriptional regulator [Baekduia soli]|uniref:Helix-turn-helix transcriptional regulator n=1 Tax=Baekduia soli TaxID=496014 RepID=A0A5B8U396_9ACTN|nr:metalloregulator ArsR/SmtB family transcription factor [Baekduia soli]QEC47537.1 helix-turn-helix transcriptional regulator [Baekduia soli]